jgi:DNA-binding NarL/FixJ family response regulator
VRRARPKYRRQSEIRHFIPHHLPALSRRPSGNVGRQDPNGTGVEALTPGELGVARLAAEGHSNREIAHELYVTLKTIEGHLARTYTKLGIERRSELVRVLEGEKTRVATL